MLSPARTTTKTARRPAPAGVLEIEEYDKAGNLKATYIESSSSTSGSRVDVLVPIESKRLWRRTLDVFLPDGYPVSVSDDYTKYQIYDSFQAFAGSIAGMISSRAVWEGLGVGDATASPTSAMLIQIVRECMGKLGTITFAHAMGTSIEAECKMYRLKSDVLCDTAMVLDCLSPLLPLPLRIVLLCVSSVLYAAAGVAGGASKSSLSGHFAKWNNLGELNAKDGSQETVISLMGNLVGTVVVACLSTRTATWISLTGLLVAHLIMNWIGVRAVKMRSLNRQRANIAFSSLLDTNRVLTPGEVSDREVVFERRGGSVLRGKDGAVIGHCDFGVSLQALIRSVARSSSRDDSHDATGSSHLGPVDLETLTRVFQHQAYILWYETVAAQWVDTRPSWRVLVLLKQGVTPEQQLRAWFHALLLARRLDEAEGAAACKLDTLDSPEGRKLAHVECALHQAQRMFGQFAERLRHAGWDLDIPVLETSTGSRIFCGKKQHDVPLRKRGR